MDLTVVDGCAAAVGIDAYGAAGDPKAVDDHTADILQEDYIARIADRSGIRTTDCIDF